jgi:uncharacterized protein (TIGR03067 family)
MHEPVAEAVRLESIAAVGLNPGGRKVSAMLAARLVVLGFTASALTIAAADPSSRPALVPDDQALSAGRWDVVAVEWNGTHLDHEWLARLTVVYRADGSWAVLLRRMPAAEGRSTIRQDVTPKTFEMETVGSEGIEPTRYVGIYRIDGDTRLLCIVREGTPRPDDFSAPRHSNRMLVTLKRAKESSQGRSDGRRAR